LHARYFHYARFITHKTIASAELLLAAGMLELIRAGRLPADFSTVLASVGQEPFLRFVDDEVWAMFHESLTSSETTAELHECAGSLIHRTLLKCAVNLEGLETDDEEIYENVRLDKLMGSLEQKKKVAQAANVPLSSFCYKRSALRLTGIPARVTPKPGDQERYEWIQTVNVARPGEEPSPVVMRGLLQHLSTRRWVTRRVFVREPQLEAAEKTAAQRPTTARLAAYLNEELTR